MKLALLAVFLALPLGAQTAKVIQLSSADANERKALEDQRAAIEQKIKDFDQRIKRQYTTVLEGDNDSSGSYADVSITTLSTSGYYCIRTLSTDPAAELAYQDCEKRLATDRKKNPPSPQRMYRRGWENGLIYTEDFKFIVPAESHEIKYSTSGSSGVRYATPASYQ